MRAGGGEGGRLESFLVVCFLDGIFVRQVQLSQAKDLVVARSRIHSEEASASSQPEHGCPARLKRPYG
jgi:hypothetical protein